MGTSEDDKKQGSALQQVHAWTDLPMGPEPNPNEHDEGLINLYKSAKDIQVSGLAIISMVDEAEDRCFRTLKYFGKVFGPRVTSNTKQETILEFFQVYSNLIKVFEKCATDLTKRKKK